MASPVASVSAVEVSSIFISQYYPFLQQQPGLVYQFYNDASTMVRVDGSSVETATTLLQIDALVTSLNFTAIEIKSVHSLNSWSGGVLVTVYGSMQVKDYSCRRNFTQTFFLAPQEKGFFVLNDIFHFLDDEQIHQHPAAIVAEGDIESEVKASNQLPLPEPVPEYVIGEQQTRELVASDQLEEHDTVDKYNIPDQQQAVSEIDNIAEETLSPEKPTSPASDLINTEDPPSVPIEDSVAEPTKHTYASILRAPKRQSGTSVAPQVSSLNKVAAPVASELHHATQLTQEQHYPALPTVPEKSAAEEPEKTAAPEEGEGTSVYVRNLPSTVSTSDIEQEFKNFGKIKAEGVVIRNRLDIGVCYAFIDFEDAGGVQNAIKASPIQFSGRKVYIEERKANNSSSRGRGRGRGRGSFQSDALRGHFGTRTFGRGSGQESGDRDYGNKTRGSGFSQRGLRQGRGALMVNQVSRNGSN